MKIQCALLNHREDREQVYKCVYECDSDSDRKKGEAQSVSVNPCGCTNVYVCVKLDPWKSRKNDTLIH